jgi:hypothetical protein
MRLVSGVLVLSLVLIGVGSAQAPGPKGSPVADVLEFADIAKDLWKAPKAEREKLFASKLQGKKVHGKGTLLRVQVIMGDKTFTMNSVDNLSAVVTIAASEADKYAKLQEKGPIEWVGKLNYFSDSTGLGLGLSVQAKDGIIK